LLAAPPSTALRDKLRGGGRGGHLQVVGGTDTTPPIREPEPAPYRTAPVTPGPVAPPAGQAPSGAVTVDQLADLWPKIRADVKAVNRRVEALLASIDPVAVNGNQVVLVAAYEFHRKRMNEESVRSVVEDVLSRIFKMPLTVTCLMRGEELAASSAGFAPRPAPVVAERPPAVDARPISEPSPGSNLDEQRLQAAKNIFDGEEIPSE
jgi:DNA polymerase-3 subunit gamma/tau